MSALGDNAFLQGVDDNADTLKVLIKKAQLEAIKSNLATIKRKNVRVSIIDYSDFYNTSNAETLKQIYTDLIATDDKNCITKLSGKVDADIKLNKNFYTNAVNLVRTLCFLNAGDSAREAMFSSCDDGYNRGDGTLEEWLYLESGASILPFTYLFKKILELLSKSK